MKSLFKVLSVLVAVTLIVLGVYISIVAYSYGAYVFSLAGLAAVLYGSSSLESRVG